MGILHGDVNKHNFLIQGERAIMVDFENAQQCSDTAILIEEQAELVEELQSTSGKGGCIVENIPS
jgi:RIO-like serine/threonine protein kinase